MQNNYKELIPSNVIYIINQLQNKGYEAYMVGGCVRDIILKRNPNDWDITTNAMPTETKEIFESLQLKVIPTGIKHGTITVRINNDSYEITTYRIDGEYKDGRHPDKVSFTNELKEDLKRRDFTINAMAYNLNEGLIDYFNGVKDINHKIIKTVGNPYYRFSEDSLRMMRAVRFSAQLDFHIDTLTKEAIKSLSYRLKGISIERIREEFNKILLNNPSYLYMLRELRLLEYIIPELTIKNNIEKFEEYVAYSQDVENILYLRLTMILYEIEEYYDILKRFKYDNKTIKRVKVLIENKHSLRKSKEEIKRLLRVIGEDSFRDLLKLQRVLVGAKQVGDISRHDVELEVIEKRFTEIMNNKECFHIKDMNINGNEIMSMGVEGRKVGEILDILLDKVIDDNNLNNNLKLKNIVRKLI